MSAPRPALKPEINVTPLVDVVLVLLIIFMVVLPKMEEGAPVELPPIVHTERRGDSKVEPMSLGVTAAGEYYIEDEQIPRATLMDRLRKLQTENPDKKVVVKGDRNAPYVHVRTLFKACQDLGFKGISLQVVDKKGA